MLVLMVAMLLLAKAAQLLEDDSKVTVSPR